MKRRVAAAWRVAAAVAAAAGAAAAAGCAQPKAPPGGQPDDDPPRVVSVTPMPFDTVRDLDDPVVIRFDERISERLEGVPNLRAGVLVSPETGAVKAKRGRRDIKISVSGGWRPNLVYRVVVLPVLRDLFNNQRKAPIELVFSTGGAIEETALAGFVDDRITGKPVAMARVQATRLSDSLRYVAMTDTAGFFSMRYLPDGAYDVAAWLDPDNDRARDFGEPQDSGAFSITPGDTTILEMALLPRDSTPANLVRAEVVDSARLRLQFDDYFDTGPATGEATVFSLPDSAAVSGGTLVSAAVLDSILEAEKAAADSARAAADTTGAGADTAVSELPAGRPGGPLPGLGGRGGVPGRPGGAAQQPAEPLPSREMGLLLDRPLMPDTTYFVTVWNVTNIRGLAGGGGSARFRTPRPAPPDTAAADSTAADSTAADTVGARGAAPDSPGVKPMRGESQGGERRGRPDGAPWRKP